MKISTSELRRSFEQLMSHVEESGVTDFEIEEDFYWSIPPEKRYSPYQDPGEPTMGQLSDDLGELRAMVKGEKEVVGYGLVWLSSVLRRLGEKQVG